jgi:hypothetical protein
MDQAAEAPKPAELDVTSQSAGIEQPAPTVQSVEEVAERPMVTSADAVERSVEATDGARSCVEQEGAAVQQADTSAFTRKLSTAPGTGVEELPAPTADVPEQDASLEGEPVPSSLSATEAQTLAEQDNNEMALPSVVVQDPEIEQQSVEVLSAEADSSAPQEGSTVPAQTDAAAAAGGDVSALAEAETAPVQTDDTSAAADSVQVPLLEAEPMTPAQSEIKAMAELDAAPVEAEASAARSPVEQAVDTTANGTVMEDTPEVEDNGVDAAVAAPLATVDDGPSGVAVPTSEPDVQQTSQEGTATDPLPTPQAIAATVTDQSVTSQAVPEAAPAELVGEQAKPVTAEGVVAQSVEAPVSSSGGAQEGVLAQEPQLPTADVGQSGEPSPVELAATNVLPEPVAMTEAPLTEATVQAADQLPPPPSLSTAPPAIRTTEDEEEDEEEEGKAKKKKGGKKKKKHQGKRTPPSSPPPQQVVSQEPLVDAAVPHEAVPQEAMPPENVPQSVVPQEVMSQEVGPQEPVVEVMADCTTHAPSVVELTEAINPPSEGPSAASEVVQEGVPAVAEATEPQAQPMQVAVEQPDATADEAPLTSHADQVAEPPVPAMSDATPVAVAVPETVAAVDAPSQAVPPPLPAVEQAGEASDEEEGEEEGAHPEEGAHAAVGAKKKKGKKKKKKGKKGVLSPKATQDVGAAGQGQAKGGVTAVAGGSTATKPSPAAPMQAGVAKAPEKEAAPFAALTQSIGLEGASSDSEEEGAPPKPKSPMGGGATLGLSKTHVITEEQDF